MHVFTEINLVDHLYDENIALAKEKERVLFLSSTFLYREEIRYIKKAVSSAKCPLNYVYHVGQYLPDWHPWENYSSYFVGDKRTNGCREIMAIELPWLTHVFGDVSECHTIKSRNTHLDIDYNDNYLIQLQHINGAKGAFAVDVVSRKAVRNLEIYGEEIYLSWDGTPTGLKHYDYMGRTDHDIKLYSDNEVDHQTGYSSFVIENAYKNEIENFFGKINGGGAIFCIV
jgi:predicted dehydrogenase